MKIRYAVLAVVVSLIFALTCAEVGLRFLPVRYGPNAPTPSIAASPPKHPAAATVRNALRYLTSPARIPIAREWFLENPPALPNRTQPSKAMLARYEDFQKRGIYPSQAQYIWNKVFVERTAYNSASIVNFTIYPDTIQVFDPPGGDIHPFYRFPSNATLPSGLVTNEFGFRGPPLNSAKRRGTIRIAFVGASTTINQHDFEFSYPERVIYWLNRFAQANHYDAQFEEINAGREGINSEDISTIVHDEVVPLNPDVVVYYEGANQFPSANVMVSPRIPPRKEVATGFLRGVLSHFRTGQLIDSVLLAPAIGRAEPRKPGYRLVWPTGVDERNPDVRNAHLPLQLPTILRDLDSIRKSLEANGGQLVLSSFEWLASPGLDLSGPARRHIYEQLNTVLWPLRYADIQRLANFQNEVFRRYAMSLGIPFLDVAGRIPQDPDLFVDAIHMTEVGERVKAWVVFQQLAPWLRQQIESGRLPRNVPALSLPPLPSLAASEMSARCGSPPPNLTVRIDSALKLEWIELAYRKASISRGHPVKVTTADEQGAFAASFPIHMPASLTGPRMLYLRARVTKGLIGLGVLDRVTNDFQVEKTVDPAANMADIYVPVPNPERAAALIVRNATAGIRSQIEIEDAALMATSAPKR